MFHGLKELARGRCLLNRLDLSCVPLRTDESRTEGLDTEEWAATVLMGAAVLPLGVLMRFLPPSVEGERNFAGYKPRWAQVFFLILLR